MGERKLRVAIAGGGTVGLTLALYLHQLGACTFTVYEASPTFSAIGAGIELSHNAMKVYQELGLAEKVYSLSREALGDNSDVWFYVRLGDGRHGMEPISVPKVPVANTKLHRSDALDLLLSRIPRNLIHLGKRLTTYETSPTGSVFLLFADGTTAEADVLIGADGIKSAARQTMYRQDKSVAPVWSGAFLYRGLLPMTAMTRAGWGLIASKSNLWLGKNRHVVHYPVSRGQTVNLGAFVMDYTHGRYPSWHGTNWVEPCEKGEMVENFGNFAEPVKEMLRRLENPQKWYVFELPPLPSYTSGRVALVGDAAHAMLPHQGNGAAQGIEDVHVLANLLSHPLCTPTTVTLALKAYDEVRRPRSQRVQQTSYETSKLYSLASAAGDDPRKIDETFQTMMKWICGILMSKSNGIGRSSCSRRVSVLTK